MEIDLGKDMGETSCPEPVTSTEKGEKYYPCLYVDGDSELSKLPDSGTMTVQFAIKRRTQTKGSDGDSNSVEIEVQKILDVAKVKKSESVEDDDERSSALDKAKSEYKKPKN